MKKYDFIRVSVITPFKIMRKYAKPKVGNSYFEVYIDASLKTVIKRDVKGLYNKALNGRIKNFIGISEEVPFQKPKNSNIIINREETSINESVRQIIQSLNFNNRLNYLTN